MKIVTRAILIVFLGISSLNAALIISDFQLTTNSVTFDINGTFPSSLPANHQNVLFFVNPNVAASPGFTLIDHFHESSTASFTGSQLLRTVTPPIMIGSEIAGDYFIVAFANNFSVSEAINGTVTASWSSVVFDPLAVSSLNMFWGANESLPDPSAITGGTFLTSVNTTGVPEPSTYAMMLLLSGAGALWWLRSRKRVRDRVLCPSPFRLQNF